VKTSIEGSRGFVFKLAGYIPIGKLVPSLTIQFLVPLASTRRSGCSDYVAAVVYTDAEQLQSLHLLLDVL
jgi:hypothetical protein